MQVKESCPNYIGRATFQTMSILEMKEEVSRLNKAERLQALEVLWDAIRQEQDEPESPAWHGEVLAARLAKAEVGEAEFLTMEELKARLGR